MFCRSASEHRVLIKTCTYCETAQLNCSQSFLIPLALQLHQIESLLIKLGQFWKGTVQKVWFAYFCRYLRTFAGYLRTLCGMVLPHVFLVLDKAPNWHSLSISASKPLKAPQDSKGCEKAFNGHVVSWVQSWVLLGHVNRPTYRHQNHCDNSQLILHDCSIFMMILPCSCRSKTF